VVARLTPINTFVRTHRIELAALISTLVLGGAIRLALYFWLPALADGDSFQYYRPAHRLMDGIDFPLPLKRPPAYPWFLAAIGTLSGRGLEHVILVQNVLGIATAALAFGLGLMTFGRVAALIGGLAAAISGELLLWEHYIMTESLFAFLVTLATFLFVLGVRNRRPAAFIGCGLTIGVATLTRSHGQVMLLVGLIVLALHYPSLRRIWRPSALLTSAMLIVIVPWMIRNHLTHGTFTVAGSLGQQLVYKAALFHTGSFLFFDPSAPDRSGDTALRRTNQFIQSVIDEKLSGGGDDWAASTIHSTLQRRLDVGEADADALMRRAAIQAVSLDPLAYVFASAQTFVRVSMGVPDNLDNRWRDSRPRDERTRLAALMPRPSDEQVGRKADTRRLLEIYQSPRLGAVLLPLFALGMVASALRPAWRPALFVALTVVALNGVTAAVSSANPRYHYPTIPLLHVVATGGMLTLAGVAARGARSLWRARSAHPRARASG
jgi:4-amino-4-deoxy-L-arabinose transferase-like glycosyltransferase